MHHKSAKQLKIKFKNIHLCRSSNEHEICNKTKKNHLKEEI